MTVDVPADADLAEFMKESRYNTIYRVQPNTGVLNTCIGNEVHSFYVLEGTSIAGYDLAGNKFLCSFVNRVFTQWKRVMEEVNFLHQIKLANDDFSNTDFVVNMRLISNKLANYNRRANLRITAGRDPNLYASLLQRLKDDNVCDFTGQNNVYFTLKFEGSDYNINDHTKIELFMDNAYYRPVMLIAYMNADNANTWFSGFHEVAQCTKVLSDISLLNGWKTYNNIRFNVYKVGDYVYLGFTIDGGTRTQGTVIANLPTDFIPKQDMIIPTPYTGNPKSQITINTKGQVLIYGWAESTGYVVVEGGYYIRR